MNSYLDASCFIRRIASDGLPVLDWDASDPLWTSVLTRVEVARTLNRLRVEGRYSGAGHEASLARFADLSGGVEWLPITSEVLALAVRSTPFHLKTLDALHLATAMRLRDASNPSLVFATHDRRLARAAITEGFVVVGV